MNAKTAKALRKLAKQVVPDGAPETLDVGGHRNRTLVGSGTIRESYRGFKKAIKRGEPFKRQELFLE